MRPLTTACRPRQSRTPRVFQFSYGALSIPDGFDIFDQGNTLLTPASRREAPCSACRTSSTSTLVTVIVTDDTNTSTA